MSKKFLLFLVMVLAIQACKNEKPKPAETKHVEEVNIATPAFNQDSSYVFVEKQLSFGYRVTGTKEHKACGQWIMDKLDSYGAKVTKQDFKSNFFGKKDIPSFNIIGAFNPEAKNRIIIAAHWDTRMVGDKDPKVKNKPIMGADDGASGVANLIEIARLLKEQPVAIGVDLIFFDAEDNGLEQEGWCQGSDYWSKNLHVSGYKANFGILFDLVGAKNAKFGHEGLSKKYAGVYVNKIWAIAQGMGYTDLFINEETGPITDDHYYVMSAGIPMVDIINCKPNTQNETNGGFPAHHHTQEDNIGIIDKRTLGATGRVVTEVIYRFAQNKF